MIRGLKILMGMTSHMLYTTSNNMYTCVFFYPFLLCNRYLK